MLGQEEGSKAAELRKKHEIYRQKLERSVEVLNDYIIATQSTIVDEAYLGAKITLGAYDADNMQFELVAHDSSSKKSPFYFKGKVTVPIDTAKIKKSFLPCCFSVSFVRLHVRRHRYDCIAFAGTGTKFRYIEEFRHGIRERANSNRPNRLYQGSAV